MPLSAVYLGDRETLFDDEETKPLSQELDTRDTGVTDEEVIESSGGSKLATNENPAVTHYCAGSEPCKFTVCPWTRKLEEFGYSPLCYSVLSGCECRRGLICAMSYDIYHRSVTNTATSYCRAQPFKVRFPFKKHLSRDPYRRSFLQDNFIYRKKY